MKYAPKLTLFVQLVLNLTVFSSTQTEPSSSGTLTSNSELKVNSETATSKKSVLKGGTTASSTKVQTQAKSLYGQSETLHTRESCSRSNEPLCDPLLRCYYTNATSLVNKSNLINFEIKRLNEPGILCFSETWFTNEYSLNIDNYSKFSNHRESMKGGGVAIYVRSDITAYEIVEHSGSAKILTSCLYFSTF